MLVRHVAAAGRPFYYPEEWAAGDRCGPLEVAENHALPAAIDPTDFECERVGAAAGTVLIGVREQTPVCLSQGASG